MSCSSQAQELASKSSLTPEKTKVQAGKDCCIRGVVRAQDEVVGPNRYVGTAALDGKGALTVTALGHTSKEADLLVLAVGVLASVEHSYCAVRVLAVAGALAGALSVLEPVGAGVLRVPVPQEGGDVEVLGCNSIDI